MPPSRGEDYPYARRTIRGQRTRIDIPYMSSQGVRPCSSTLALQNGDGHPNNAGIRAGRRGFRCRLHAICRVPAYIRPETYSRMPLVGTDSGDTPPWKCPHFIRGVRLRCFHGAIFAHMRNSSGSTICAPAAIRGRDIGSTFEIRLMAFPRGWLANFVSGKTSPGDKTLLSPGSHKS